MADHADDLIDYEEEDESMQTDAPTADQPTGNGQDLSKENTKDKKGSYVGIHSTGFRDFLLKPELLRAIVDCGFEHPSEGLYYILYLYLFFIYFQTNLILIKLLVQQECIPQSILGMD